MKRKRKNTDPKAIDASRRGLLSGALGLGAAGVGLAALGGHAAGNSAPQAAAHNIDPSDAGYHETDHIRRYYRSAW